MVKLENIIDSYGGFDIDSSFSIFKGGKRHHLAGNVLFNSIEQAKSAITKHNKRELTFFLSPDLTNYQERQASKYGNVLQEPFINPDGGCELESGSEEMERFTEWNNEMAERQMEEQEY